MKKIVIIYYSRSGNTAEMAKLIAEGARSVDGVHTDIFSVADIDAKKMLEYDGIILGSPTYYGSMAYEIKKLIDESVAFHGKLDGKVGAAFTSAANIGGGNETTILDMLNAMLIHGMVIQGNAKGDHYGPVSVGKPDERVKKQCNELGQRTAALVLKIA